MALKQKELIAKLRKSLKDSKSKKKNNDKESDSSKKEKDKQVEVTTTTLQTLIFDKNKFTKEQAIEWAKDHDFKFGKVDETKDAIRLRQKDPDEFQEGSFRTIEMTDGVKAVIGRPKKEEKEKEEDKDKEKDKKDDKKNIDSNDKKIMDESGLLELLNKLNEKIDLITEALAVLMESNEMMLGSGDSNEEEKAGHEDEDKEEDEEKGKDEDEKEDEKRMEEEDEDEDENSSDKEPGDMTDEEVEKELKDILGELDQFA